jgi:antitoxin YefM
MNALTYSTARSNLAGLMEKVCENHEPMIITKKGNITVVMLSLEDYEAMEETNYLIRSPKNAKRLMEGLKQLDDGKKTVKTLEDLKRAGD